MIFLCYSKENYKEARSLRALLESAGVAVWMAPESIPPGTLWPEAIVDALHVVSAVVVLVSRWVCSSRQIPHELEIADREQLPLIPVRLEEVELTGAAEYWLADRQWTDYNAVDLAEQIKRALTPQEGKSK